VSWLALAKHEPLVRTTGSMLGWILHEVKVSPHLARKKDARRQILEQGRIGPQRRLSQVSVTAITPRNLARQRSESRAFE
jgi:hypothetical protein